VKSSPDASVVVRARNEAGKLRRCLEQLGAQRVGGRTLELILVDHSSSDATVSVARAHGARVISLAPDSFTFGHALNLGCANARAQIVVSLSADAIPTDAGWLDRLLEPFADSRVACASGDSYGPAGEPLATRIEQDAPLAHEHPGWGYSNAAGALRADLWRRRPFRDDLPGCEDKEWALHWLERGYVCVVDPGLVVEHDHTHDPLRSIYARARREWRGLGMFQPLAPYGPADLLADWWSDLRWYSSPLRARLSHRRAARLLGSYAGRRDVRRRGARRRERRSAPGS
jgi:rhamnosyltransferase